MPKMSMQIPHSLSKEEAQSRVQGMITNLKEQYGDRISDLNEEWHGDTGQFSFRAMGYKLAGTLQVTESDVRVNGDIPWAAKPFQGTIEATIRERTERLLRP
ncbi:MAG TPA: polyhydroxyalkanoic acid system family protein [Thermomicrobiales bacterium]|nr:polyhydroxyalkanoic acid system family protein [Thermomicrobiales bacterium]